MGSPYLVHTQVNRIHVIRTQAGFTKVCRIVARTMGIHDSYDLLDLEGPEAVVMNGLREAFTDAFLNNRRVVLFLEARYEWTNWEKFQRVIVLDLTKKTEKPCVTCDTALPYRFVF